MISFRGFCVFRGWVYCVEPRKDTEDTEDTEKKQMAKTFEASLAELERIVAQLENGDLPLEESLKLFETGVKLSRECRERLSVAERRIEVLMKDGSGNLNLSELSPEHTGGGGEPAAGKRYVFGDD